MNRLGRVRAAEMDRENRILEAVAAAAGDDLQLDWREEVFRADLAIAREKRKKRPSVFAETRRRRELERLRSIYGEQVRFRG